MLVIVAGAVGAAQLNERPSGQTARNWTLTVGSGSSVSGDSKSRVLSTSSVPCTVEPSAHSCGTAQKAEAVSSKKSDLTADAAVANVRATASAASVVLNMCNLPGETLLMLSNSQYRRDHKPDSVGVRSPVSRFAA